MSMTYYTVDDLRPGRSGWGVKRFSTLNDAISHYPYGWPDVGDLTAGDMFSIAWRCLDAQLCGVAQRRKRIFLLADFAGPLAPQLLFDVFDETENSEKEVS